jgi:hypothetical protein
MSKNNEQENSMAKQTKSTTPSTPATPAAAPAGEKGQADVFVRCMKDGLAVSPAKRVAPQAQVILNTIEAAGDAGLTREQLVKNLTGVIVTRQPVGRIVTYYQKSLVDGGLITLAKAPSAAA